MPEKNVIVRMFVWPSAAAKASDELRREAQQHRRQLAARHQLGGQDEERHRLQREQVDAARTGTSAARSAARCRDHIATSVAPPSAKATGTPSASSSDAGDEEDGRPRRPELRRVGVELAVAEQLAPRARTAARHQREVNDHQREADRHRQIDGADRDLASPASSVPT